MKREKKKGIFPPPQKNRGKFETQQGTKDNNKKNKKKCHLQKKLKKKKTLLVILYKKLKRKPTNIYFIPTYIVTFFVIHSLMGIETEMNCKTPE